MTATDADGAGRSESSSYEREPSVARATDEVLERWGGVLDRLGRGERSKFGETAVLERVDAEFGMLSESEASAQINSGDPSSGAAAARAAGRVLAVNRSERLLFPGFQFDGGGVRPVIAHIITKGKARGRSELGLVEWMMSPTTYLDGKRPVDVIEDPDQLLRAADAAFGVEW